MSPHPLRALCLTFLAGVLSSLVFGVGILLVGVEPAVSLVDIGGDGMDVRDFVVLAILFGNAAILTHHVLPALMRA